MIMLLMLFSLLDDYLSAEEPKTYKKESEVKTMTMDEVKQKLLDRIDSMLEGGDAEDVRKLSEAYSLLRKDALLEKLTENRNSLFTGICNCDAGTKTRKE